MGVQRARKFRPRCTTSGNSRDKVPRSVFISHHDHYKGSLSKSLSRLSARSFNLMCCNDPIVVQTPAKPSSSGSISLDGRRSGDVLDPNAKDAFASTAGSNPCGQLTTQNECYAQATRSQKARAKGLRVGVQPQQKNNMSGSL